MHGPGGTERLPWPRARGTQQGQSLLVFGGKSFRAPINTHTSSPAPRQHGHAWFALQKCRLPPPPFPLLSDK